MLSFRTRIFCSVLMAALIASGIAVYYGRSSFEQSQVDAARERLLRDAGYNVFRLRAEDVLLGAEACGVAAPGDRLDPLPVPRLLPGQLARLARLDQACGGPPDPGLDPETQACDRRFGNGRP